LRKTRPGGTIRANSNRDALRAYATLDSVDIVSSAVLRSSLPLCLLLVCTRAAAAQVTTDTIPARADSAAAAVAPLPAPAPAPDSTATADSSATTVAPAPAPDSAAARDSAAVAAPASPRPVTPASAPAPVASDALAPGDLVRLRSAAGRYSGRLVRVTADTLVVAAPGRSDAVVRSDITELYRLKARSSRGRAMLRGAGAGFVAGAALGLLAGITVGHVDCNPTDTDCRPGQDRTIGVALTAEGAILGGLVGVMMGPRLRETNWERIDAAPPAPASATPSIGVAPAPGGGVSIRATLRL
jgi:hypothetical protein